MLAIQLAAQQHVVQFRMHGHRPVGRDSPGGGRPDHQCRRSSLNTGTGRKVRHIHHTERHINGRGYLVVVFHFRFRQGRSAVQTPVHRLETLLQMTVVDDLAQGADDVRLEGVIHGQVGIVPVAEHAQTLKIGLLSGHLLAGVFPTLLAKGAGIHLVAGLADLLFHHQLDGQTMAVPARHVGGIKAGQGTGLDDHILEDLVHRMADMNVAVGVRRAIMKNELGTAGKDLTDFLVELFLLPLFQPRRFALGQAGFHGKVGLGKIKRCLVVRHSPVLNNPVFSK